MSVRHALLALLSEGPTYGLRLRQEFEARTGEVWPLNVGQVYTTLQRLERDGLIESDDAGEAGPQKRFGITDAGVEELGAWLRTPPNAGTPPRDELVIKVLVSLRVPGVDVAGLLQVHRRHLVTTMQHFTRLKQEAADDVGLLLVADAELFRLEAVVRWLDAAEGRLNRRSTTARFDTVDPSDRADVAGRAGGPGDPATDIEAATTPVRARPPRLRRKAVPR